jgi:hypothetical protein
MTNTISSGDKCAELYMKSKIIKIRNDKTTEEIEYERNKSECTFAPKLERLDVEDQRNRNRIKEDKFIQREIDRLKKGREEKERIKKFTERGIVLKKE